MSELKEGLEGKNNANMEHVIMLLRALIVYNPKDILYWALDKKYFNVMLVTFDNKHILALLFDILVRPQTLCISSVEHAKFIKTLIKLNFFDILIDMST